MSIPRSGASADALGRARAAPLGPDAASSGARRRSSSCRGSPSRRPTWPSPKPRPRAPSAVAVVAAVGGSRADARDRRRDPPSMERAHGGRGGRLFTVARGRRAHDAGPHVPPIAIAATRPSPRVTHAVVVASPSSARIYLDDTAVPNPYLADHLADETAHRLRVEAPGYETKTRVVTFAGDLQLELELVPQPSSPPAPPPDGPGDRARSRRPTLPAARFRSRGHGVLRARTPRPSILAIRIPSKSRLARAP